METSSRMGGSEVPPALATKWTQDVDEQLDGVRGYRRARILHDGHVPGVQGVLTQSEPEEVGEPLVGAEHR